VTIVKHDHSSDELRTAKLRETGSEQLMKRWSDGEIRVRYRLHPTEAFATENLDLDHHGYVSKAELYEVYVNWCHVGNYVAKGRPDFQEELVKAPVGVEKNLSEVIQEVRRGRGREHGCASQPLSPNSNHSRKSIPSSSPRLKPIHQHMAVSKKTIKRSTRSAP
jgi:hypothetical protein